MASARKTKRSKQNISKRGFVKGSILRIKLENFLTYDDVEFIPGPHLNMVIGPNGTGKSSIVCAIALGLGGRTSVLGRAKDPLDYIKYGKENGSVEIELCNPSGENWVVKRFLSKRERGSRWHVNNQSTTLKAVEELTAALDIQVGNLCQFLPQEKVDEFAKMNNIELLESTEKAVGGIKMFEDHCTLKTSRDSGRDMETELARTRQILEQEMSKNARLEGEVETYQQRQKHIDRINLLKMKKPWAEYAMKRERLDTLKTKKDEAQANIKKARDLNKPLQNKMDHAKRSLENMDKDIHKKSDEIKSCAKIAAEKNKNIEEEVERMDDILQDFELKKTEEAKRERKIRELKDQLRILENEYNSLDIRDVQPEIQRVSTEMRQVSMELTRVMQEGEKLYSANNDLKKEIKEIQAELRQLQDVSNQRLTMLRTKSRDAYNAVMWLRENKDKFVGAVHEPIMTVVNVKDPQYTKYVESHIAFKDMLAFVCEDPADQQLLLRTLREEQRLRINIVTMPTQPSESFRPDKPIKNYQQYGFYAYVRDLFNCPEAVMRFLCQMYHVHRIPVGNRYTKDHVQNVIQKCPEMKSFYTENHRYKVTVSRYTGESSTSSFELREPSLLTKTFDSVRDRQLRQELEQKEQQLSELDLQMRDVSNRHKQLETKMNSLRNQKKELTEKRDAERSLAQKIKSKQQTITSRQSEALDLETEQRNLAKQVKASIVKRMRFILVMKEKTKMIVRLATEKVGLSLKKMALIEEADRIQTEFSQKSQLLRSLEVDIEKLVDSIKNAKAEAKAQLTVAKKATNTDSSENLSPELTKAFESIKEKTLEEIENAITEEQARATMCATTDESVINEYHARKKTIADLQKKVGSKEKALDKHNQSIAHVKTQWEENVQSMINRINAKFGYLFEQIKCAGEVILHRPDNPEDYGHYGVKIRVKYRDNEPLRELTAHLQSGGERSVATVLYMMALQEMTSCPFRCVDEINQGMDPHNERKVFDLVVRTSCKENTSQYFLLTPKLLSNLNYSDRMTVLCVWNGAQMMHHKQWSLSSFLTKRASLMENECN